MNISSNIHNGGFCKAYEWSQSYSDLEIRVKLNKPARYEDVNVHVDAESIKVGLCLYNGFLSAPSVTIGDEFSVDLMAGIFEHPIDVESSCWVLDPEEPAIVVHIDKSEPLWWRSLLKGEQSTVQAPRDYSINVGNLDQGSRLVVDKLVYEQKNKKAHRSPHA